MPSPTECPTCFVTYDCFEQADVCEMTHRREPDAMRHAFCRWAISHDISPNDLDGQLAWAAWQAAVKSSAH